MLARRIGVNFDMTCTRILYSSVSILGLMVCSAQADDFVVSGAASTTNDGHVIDGDDTFTVNAAGTLIVTGDAVHGVSATGDQNTVTNDGTVTTTGTGAHGVVATGNGNTAINGAVITTFGDASSAINVVGNDASAINNGSISTNGAGSNAVVVTGDDLQAINNGTITTLDADARGMSVSGTGGLVINNGTLLTGGTAVHVTGQGILTNNTSIISAGDGVTVSMTGEDHELFNGGSINSLTTTAVELSGANGTITNAGAITAFTRAGVSTRGDGMTLVNFLAGTISGGTSHGVSVLGNEASVTNLGTITAADLGYGIFILGDGSNVINGGMITTADEFGINLVGDNNTGTNNGTLDPGNSIAMVANGDGNRLINTGALDTRGDSSGGLRISGNMGVIDNSGSIATDLRGIDMLGDDGQITNSGSIVTSLSSGVGIGVTGDRVAIDNSGTIDTSGTAAHGVEVIGDDAMIVNHADGVIWTTVSGSSGLRIEGNNGTVVNHGEIAGFGGDSPAVDILGNSNQVQNLGTIETSADFSSAIATQGDMNAVENSNRITTTGWFSDGIRVVGTGSSSQNHAINRTAGHISTEGQNASGMLLAAGGAGSYLLNQGSIETNAASSHGMRSSNVVDVMLTNDGTIHTFGEFSSGMFLLSGNGSAINNGDIQTEGDTGHGIRVTANASDLLNAGTVSTLGFGANGIHVVGSGPTSDDLQQIANTGEVSTTGDSAAGAYVFGEFNLFENAGTITTTGANAQGVLMAGNDNTLINNGTIDVQGIGAHGVHMAAFDSTVTNFGTILSTTGPAILMSNGNATLNLGTGSVLQGTVQFADSGTGSLNFLNPMNVIIDTLGTAPDTITSTTNSHFVQGGSLVVMLDPTGFGAAGKTAGDLSGMIADATEGAQTGGATAEVGRGLSLDTSRSSGAFWGQVMGGVRRDQANDASSAFSGVTGGLIAGRDLANGFGVFAGGGFGRLEGASDAFENTSQSLFAGIYKTTSIGTFDAKLSLALGMSANDSERTIANGGVPGGIETASGSYNSYFISPSVLLSKSIARARGTLTPSFGLRYTGVRTQGYTETGVLSPMTIEGSTSHIVQARAQVAYDFNPRNKPNGTLASQIYGGLSATTTFGDEVTASLAGDSVSFETTDGVEMRGYVGLKGVFTGHKGGELIGGVELGRSTKGSTTVNANLRFNLRF